MTFDPQLQAFHIAVPGWPLTASLGPHSTAICLTQPMTLRGLRKHNTPAQAGAFQNPLIRSQQPIRGHHAKVGVEVLFKGHDAKT